MRKSTGWAALFVLALLGGCAGAASVGDAEKEIAAFHRQLDAENYSAIWQAASADMKGATSETQFMDLLGAVHRKLGKVVRTEQVGWNSNVSTSGSFAQVQMDTTFEHGKGMETFIYRKVDEELKLSGYNINSTDMMLK